MFKMNKKLEKDLIQILDLKKINLETKISQLKNWDSIVFIQIITLAKNEYKKNINGNDLDKLKTLADLIALLKK